MNEPPRISLFDVSRALENAAVEEEGWETTSLALACAAQNAEIRKRVHPVYALAPPRLPPPPPPYNWRRQRGQSEGESAIRRQLQGSSGGGIRDFGVAVAFIGARKEDVLRPARKLSGRGTEEELKEERRKWGEGGGARTTTQAGGGLRKQSMASN